MGLMEELQKYYKTHCVHCNGTGVINVKSENRHYTGKYIVTYDRYKCKYCNGTGKKE